MAAANIWEEAAKAGRLADETAQSLRNAGFVLPSSIKGTVTEAQPQLQIIRTPKQEAAARLAAQADDGVADVMSGTKKSRTRGFLGGAKSKAGDLYGSYRNRPLWQQAILPGVGALSLGGALFGRDEEVPIDLGKINVNTLDEQIKRQEELSKLQRDIINEKYFNMPKLNIPGAEVYNPLSALTNQAGASTIAEMQRLANDAANQAAAIKAAGVQGAADINSVYGGAADEMSNIGSYGGEYGAMTPVSGAMATAPSEARMEGQNLADFLQQNQLISAQDAGFIAQSAPQIASGYANQLAMNDYIARQQQDMLRQRALEQRSYDNEIARRDEIAASRLDEANRLALLEMGGQPLYTEDQLTAVAKEWNEASDTQKAIWAQYGINSAEQLFERTVLQAPQMTQE
jgi:hypothetical protein